MTRKCIKCKKAGGFLFPHEKELCELWLKKLKLQNQKMTPLSVVCHEHFKKGDWYMAGCVRRLKKNSVPFVEDGEIEIFCETEIEVGAEETVVVEDKNTEDVDSIKTVRNVAASCPIKLKWVNPFHLFSIEAFENNPKAVHFYTGLESYSKFVIVFNTLVKVVDDLKYARNVCSSLSAKNQFFLFLIKLRRYKTHFELSLLFRISEYTVGNIFLSWLDFAYKKWSSVDIWPSRALIDFYMPEQFRKSFPTTRVILDGMEIPIMAPEDPVFQKATFSSYKNRNTLKAIIGISPGGLITYVSKAYGGSVSDRQIIERSDLLQKCEAGDSIMADRGINVQDLFAAIDVHVNIPTFMTGKNQLPGLVAKHDRKIAAQRVHVERVIGLGKTYKILRTPLNRSEASRGTEIIFICFMLCNFRNPIM